MSKPYKAIACANIALAKYWGKVDTALNLPAVPSISLTLDELRTETTVTFRKEQQEDEFLLDGRPVRDKQLLRVQKLLDDVRGFASTSLKARVESRNFFPTAAGLASSASGFAALAAASSGALQLSLGEEELSRIARRASASAARSIFGGYVELPAGVPGDDRLSARPLMGSDWWDLRFVIAVTRRGPKAIGSTQGMELSRKTSPLYPAWLERAPQLANEVREAILARDLPRLGIAMEQSTFAFHSCAMSSNPSILYWYPGTLGVLHAVRALRDKEGVSAWTTMDAGPHVKTLCAADESLHVAEYLKQVPEVLEVSVARPGPGVNQD